MSSRAAGVIERWPAGAPLAGVTVGELIDRLAEVFGRGDQGSAPAT